MNQKAKQTTTGSDGGPQYQTAQDSTKVFSSHQTGWHRESKDTKRECRGIGQAHDVLEVVYIPPAQTKVKGEYRTKLKSSDEFNIFIFYTAT